MHVMPRGSLLGVSLAALVLSTLPTPATAQRAPASQSPSQFRVALTPLSTMGSEAKSSTMRQLAARIEKHAGSLPRITVVSAQELNAALNKSNKPTLRTCDGQASCLAQVGQLVNADYSIFGEVGGLGDAQVVYLKLVAVKRERVIRSTTLELGATIDDQSVRAAVIRLLAPSDYQGLLNLTVDVEGATIYLNGRQIGRSPSKPLRVTVGSHALRVTHPEFRDFVRFIDVEFEKTTAVTANLQQFPIVASQIRRSPTQQVPLQNSTQSRQAPPWYTRWYTIAGASAVALVSSAVLFAILADGIDADQSRTLEPPMRAPNP